MFRRSAKSRILSRSGQPRRRLSRRRQQLPNPVLITRKSEDVAIRMDLDPVGKFLGAASRDGTVDLDLIETNKLTAEVDSLDSV